jgi:hypothetical protein
MRFVWKEDKNEVLKQQRNISLKISPLPDIKAAIAVQWGSKSHVRASYAAVWKVAFCCLCSFVAS